MFQFFKKNKLITTFILLSGFLVFNSASAISSELMLRNKIEEPPGAIKLRGGVKIDQNDQIITLNLRESNLRQVLRMLSNKAGINVLLHDSVSGYISLDLVDVELNRAFEYIMTVNSLTYWKDGNTLIIANNEMANEMGLNINQVKPIKIKYTNAQRVANFLNTNVFSINRPNTSTSGIVTSNPATNEILIFGSNEDIRMAEEIVSYLDRRSEVKSFEVNFIDPISMASKICWAVFNSSEGSKNVEKLGELREGSETTLVCGNTDMTTNTEGKSTLMDFQAPSFWVLANTGLNQVTIYGGTGEQMVMAEEIIKNFDKREPQIYMEISIIELNQTDNKSLDFNHFYADRRNQIGIGGISTLARLFGDVDLDSNITDGFGIVNSIMRTRIEAAIVKNQGKVLANPRIVAANNVSSFVQISSEIVESITSRFDEDTKITSRTITIGPGESINFNILPKVSPNGFVTISLTDFTFSTIKEKFDAGEEAATLRNIRTVDAKQVRVKDGDTFIIGGLIQEREISTNTKVPIIGSIPILGTLFNNQTSSKERSELIIMITPRILKDSDEVVKL